MNLLQHFFRANARPLLKLPLQVLRAEVDVCGNGRQVGLLAVVVVEKLYRGGDAGELDLLGSGHRIFSLFWIKGKTLLQFARQYFR